MSGKDFSELNHERLFKAISHKETDRPPVFPLINGPFIAYFAGIPIRDYYNDPKKMLKAQLLVHERFYNITPIYADGGVVVEMTALGGKAEWDIAGIPQVKPFLDLEDIDKIDVPDPKRDGWMPKQIRTYEFMMKNVKKGIKVDFGYLVIGPVTLAGSLRGMSNFLIDLFKAPDSAKKLLKICHETAKLWAKTQEEIIGISQYGPFMGDDAASFLTPMQFKDFILPLYKDFYETFPKAHHWYHNDMNATHLLELLVESGVEVFNPSYDLDLVSAKKRVGKKICFLGNIPPLEVLKDGSVNDVKKQCRILIENMTQEGEGGFILSSGGYLNAGTPPENLDTMINTVKNST